MNAKEQATKGLDALIASRDSEDQEVLRAVLAALEDAAKIAKVIAPYSGAVPLSDQIALARLIREEKRLHSRF